MNKLNAQPQASHFVDGEYLEDTKGNELISCYPASGEPIAKLYEATDSVIDKAMKAAEKAQKEWSKVSFQERANILVDAGKIVRERNDEFARVETLDTGKAIQETLVVDAVSAADNLEYFGHLCATLTNEQIPVDEHSFAYTLREPLGIVAAVGAWNYPVQTCSWKVAPSLAMGNALIFKPSELTPLSALILAECLKKAGVPDGLFNVIQGRREVGAKLVAHDKVAKASLTGSVPTGKKIMEAAATNSQTCYAGTGWEISTFDI